MKKQFYLTEYLKMNDNTGIFSHNKINLKNEDLTLDESIKQLKKELLIPE